MAQLYIPTEEDVKRWVKEAVAECFATLHHDQPGEADEPLLNRKEIAGMLRVSLVTLTDWMKRGLPYHKQRGRVYLLKSEVLAFIKAHSLGPCRPNNWLPIA